MWFLLRKLLNPQPELSWFGCTDTGRARSHNEDAHRVLAAGRLLVVADGMGGHNAGETASRLAVDSLAEFFSPATIDKSLGNPQEARHLLVTAVRQANETVINQAHADASLAGMGCTLLVGLIDRNILHTCHVGDTRCYRAAGKKLQQITSDHSAMAPTNTGSGNGGRPRLVLTRVVGFPFQEDPEYHETRLAAGDRLLFCSDGLWSMLPDPRLYAILQEASHPEAACRALIEGANAAGGRDNITAVVVFV
jgi:PPM family protein phosphatase